MLTPATNPAVPGSPTTLCSCGHARRLHGSRAGLIRPDLSCRAWLRDHECSCSDFDPTDLLGDNMTKSRTPAVRFKTAAGAGGRERTTFAAFVTLPGTDDEVRVRFENKPSGTRWACDDCGRHRIATCPHEQAAKRAWNDAHIIEEDE